MKEEQDLYSVTVPPTEGVRAPAPNLIDESSFGGLYDKYFPLLRKIAMRKFGVPRDDVDPLIQDVFMTYLVQQSRVREVHPYLVGAICIAARDYWRKMNRERDFFSAVGDSPISIAVEDHMLESVAQNLLVRSALSQLGPSCREALHRFYVEGETAAAIASSRETTQNSILQLLHYCRGRVRAAYLALIQAS